MEAFLRSFYEVHPTLGAEQRKAEKRPRATKAALSSSFSSSRYIVWPAHERQCYQLLRSGIPLGRREDADRLFVTSTLSEEHFYIFRHLDPHLERNALVPKYEAAYFFSDLNQYVRVKKCHLKLAYQLAGRCTNAHIWSMVDSELGLPYWVDRHAFSKKKQQRSKRKYEASKVQ